MTIDPFTTAANAAAREYARTPRMNVGTVRDRIGEAHAAGWEAARTHLAAQEPTDAEKDAAMDALGCELRVVENGQSTCDLHGGYATSDDVCEVVEVALSAARAARRDEEKR